MPWSGFRLTVANKQAKRRYRRGKGVTHRLSRAAPNAKYTRRGQAEHRHPTAAMRQCNGERTVDTDPMPAFSCSATPESAGDGSRPAPATRRWRSLRPAVIGDAHTGATWMQFASRQRLTDHLTRFCVGIDLEVGRVLGQYFRARLAID